MLLNFEPNAARVRESMEREGSESPRASLHVPHLFEIEVLHVLRRLTLGGRISQSRGLLAIRLLSEMRLIRYSHVPFLGRIWELRRNVTAYDASYLALAEAPDATLLTSDRRLAQASGHHARVDLCR